MTRSPSAMVVAAQRSGLGKTLVSCALLALARKRGNKRGKKVRACKLGPDYLDPQLLSRASGSACLSLDAWAMRESSQRGIWSLLCEREADLLVVESAMGLFDGAADGRNTGSAYAFAARHGLPVLLLLSAKNCSGASLAASAKGFLHPPSVAGLSEGLRPPSFALLVNGLASARHAQGVEQALRHAFPDTPLLGLLPREDSLVLPSRHLGLVQAEELASLEGLFSRAVAWLSENADIEGLLDFARPVSVSSCCDDFLLPPPAQRIAVARDRAFRFFYAAQAERWVRSGAEVSFFSPLADEVPSADAEWIHLPGGYPELSAAEIASKRRFLQGLHNAARGSKSRVAARIYGECGGYICLGKGLTDAEGVRHAMADLLPLSVSYEHKARSRLFYATAETRTPLFGSSRLSGHIFHKAVVESEGGNKEESLFSLRNAAGEDCGTTGTRVGNVCGSFFHAIDVQAIDVQAIDVQDSVL